MMKVIMKVVQGVKLIFLSGSHLAPKFFKMVANSKTLVTIFKDKLNIFYAVSVLDRKWTLQSGH